MAYTASELAAFNAGVNKSVEHIKSMVDELNTEINEVAQAAADIGRGGFGYSSTKARLKTLEVQHLRLNTLVTALKSLAPDVDVHENNAKEFFADAVEPDAVEFERSHEPGHTRIRLKTVSSQPAPTMETPAIGRMIQFPAPREQADRLFDKALSGSPLRPSTARKITIKSGHR